MKKTYIKPAVRYITCEPSVHINVGSGSGDNLWWIDTHKDTNEQNGGYWSGGWGSNAKESVEFDDEIEE